MQVQRRHGLRVAARVTKDHSASIRVPSADTEDQRVTIDNMVTPKVVLTTVTMDLTVMDIVWPISFDRLFDSSSCQLSSALLVV
jgi:hypothetical protein